MLNASLGKTMLMPMVDRWFPCLASAWSTGALSVRTVILEESLIGVVVVMIPLARSYLVSELTSVMVT